MRSLRAVVVDDEPVARRALRLHLSRHPDVELAAECPDGPSAVHAVRRHRPDLLFLDVQMPGLGGFEVLKRLALHELPFVVFVTAHDEYAVRAFEVNAIDYLLKPFDEVRFDEALGRARRQVLAAGQGAMLDRLGTLLEQVGGRGSAREPGPEYVRRLMVRDRGRIFFVSTDDIDWIESAGNYASLHAGTRSYLVRTSMAELEAKLDPAEFARIHRGTIVNLSRVQEVRPYGGSDYRAVLTTGRVLNVSRGYSARLLRDR